MFYSPQELYAGNRNGLPLDPYLYDISMKHHFGGGLQQQEAPKAPVQQNVTISDKGSKVKKPKSTMKRKGLKSTRIKLSSNINPQLNTGDQQLFAQTPVY